VNPYPNADQDKERIMAMIDAETADLDEEGQAQVAEMKAALGEMVDTMKETTEPIIGLVSARLDLVEKDILKHQSELENLLAYVKALRREMAQDFAMVLRIQMGQIQINPAWIEKLDNIAKGSE
jgi:hypothetical protein